MTDSQKLDLLLEKMGSVEDRMSSLEDRMSNLEEQMKESTAELKAMDEMILDEVERVHRILDGHIADKTVHIA